MRWKARKTKENEKKKRLTWEINQNIPFFFCADSKKKSKLIAKEAADAWFDKLLDTKPIEMVEFGHAMKKAHFQLRGNIFFLNHGSYGSALKLTSALRQRLLQNIVRLRLFFFLIFPENPFDCSFPKQ
jgi:hypothetical protein